MQRRRSLFSESRYRCAICGSDVADHLQVAHIKPLYLGGTDTSENKIVLCSACHFAVDSLPVNPNVLEEIKRDWISQGILGAKRINELLSEIIKSRHYLWTLDLSSPDPVVESFVRWARALREKKTFDADIEAAQLRLQAVKNEDEFIRSILWPLFVAMGFEDITILHHNQLQENGKDMVFYNRDRLGSFTVYAVVACCKKIHTNSSRTSDAGHYAKIIDQVRKCCDIEWEDINLKRRSFIDKVVIATPLTIADGAIKAFQAWYYREVCKLQGSVGLSRRGKMYHCR